MSSPFVGIACFGVVFVGIVLIAQGSWKREPDLFRGIWGPASSGPGVEYAPERHPGRLVAVGAALMVAGVLGAIAWASTF